MLNAGEGVDALKHEIEVRSQELASQKIRQFEQDMNHTIALMLEHELLQAEQDKLTEQEERLAAARLSPIYETLRELIFFKDFSDAELAEVLHIGVWHEREKSEAILHEGDEANSFYVMMSGSAGVFKREKLIGLVQAGENFGEFAYLMGDQSRRYADVIAKSHVEYLEFSVVELKHATLEVRFQFAVALACCQTRRLLRANGQIINLLVDE